MIDSGELDWKVIAISVDDPLADRLNGVADVERQLPGYISGPSMISYLSSIILLSLFAIASVLCMLVTGIREWFRWYKTPDGKPLNRFGYSDRCLDREEALDVVKETHEAWERLLDRKKDKDAGLLWT